MVLLTMTPSMVDGLEKLQKLQNPSQLRSENNKDNENEVQRLSKVEPTLADPAVGKPIAHSQVVDLWRKLKTADGSAPGSLEQLLMTSRVYIPPAPPKAEPTEEFKALMARLRRDEDERTYERMVQPPQRLESSRNRFHNMAHTFAEVNRPHSAADLGDDEVTFNDVHRQVMLIINFMVSILGVAGTLWVAARWWSTPARLFLTMGGSILVGIAEVAVYSTYVWRLGESKSRQDKAKEVKEVVQSWTVRQGGGDEDEDEKTVLLRSKDDDADGTVRKRNTVSK